MSSKALTHNFIYTVIYNSVISASSSAYVTAVYNPVPASFPAVCVREVDRHVDRKYVDLNRTDSQHTSTYQVQVFSNKKTGAMSEAYTILNAIKAAFKGLYYIEDMEKQIDNYDPSVYRLVAEFSRTIGDGDRITVADSSTDDSDDE